MQNAPDKDRDVYIESLGNYYTTSLHFDFDDNNDVQLYEVSPKYLEEVKYK